MENIVTGYQYGAEKQFIGQYKFERNLDSDKLHMPPNTTLVKPPEFAYGMNAYWDGNGWVIAECPCAQREIRAKQEMAATEEAAAKAAAEEAAQNEKLHLAYAQILEEDRNKKPVPNFK